MNKSHITSDQVKSVLQMYWHADDPSKIFSNVDLQDMRRALESAFPEPSIQELLRDEERSARHDDPQQPAAFGKLVVSEEMAEGFELDYADCIGDVRYCHRYALQSFVDAHSIKPIAFADRLPDIGDKIYVWQSSGKYWFTLNEFEHRCITPNQRYWLPASALPIPLTAVDAKESAWKEFDKGWHTRAEKLLFVAGYEAGQANILKSTKD